MSQIHDPLDLYIIQTSIIHAKNTAKKVTKDSISPQNNSGTPYNAPQRIAQVHQGHCPLDHDEMRRLQ